MVLCTEYGWWIAFGYNMVSQKADICSSGSHLMAYRRLANGEVEHEALNCCLPQPELLETWPTMMPQATCLTESPSSVSPW